MTEEVKPDPQQATTQDAQLAAERMAEGEEATQSVDFDADYAASKELSVSEVDQSGAGAQAAEAATGAANKMPQPTEMKSSPEAHSNPDDYREMAKDVNPRA